MHHQKHVPPDWLVEGSLAILIAAVLVMGIIALIQRLRAAAENSAKSKLKLPKSKAKGKRRKNPSLRSKR